MFIIKNDSKSREVKSKENDILNKEGKFFFLEKRNNKKSFVPFHFLEFVVYTKYELLEKSVTQIKVEDINGIIDGIPIFYKKNVYFQGRLVEIFCKFYGVMKKYFL